MPLPFHPVLTKDHFKPEMTEYINQDQRKFKEAKESVTPGSPIERRASEGTALDTVDAEPWEHHLATGKTRSASASASAGVGASFARRPMSGMGLVGTERNFSLDYRSDIPGEVAHAGWFLTRVRSLVMTVSPLIPPQS